MGKFQIPQCEWNIPNINIYLWFFKTIQHIENWELYQWVNARKTNSIAIALELRLFCTNPSICTHIYSYYINICECIYSYDKPNNVGKPVTQYMCTCYNTSQIAKFMGANMGPTWVLSAPDGLHVGPMNLAIWGNKPLLLRNNIQCSAIIPSQFSKNNPHNGHHIPCKVWLTCC